MAEDKKVHVRLVRHKWADEIEIEKQNKRRKIIFISAILVSFLMGALFGGIVGKPNASVSRSEFSIFESVYNIMNHDWYFSKDKENLDSDLMNAAISGMVNEQGDPHTVYMTQEQMSAFSSSLESSFVGIGIRYERLDGNLMVKSTILDSPAQEAGIKAGDLILKADGVVLADLSDEEVQNRVRGKEGTEVVVTVQRGQDVFDVKVVRKEVHTSIDSRILSNGIGYMQVTSFGDKTAEEMKTHLDNFVKNDVGRIIIDLRDNGGGYLHSLQKMASYFLDNGSVVLQQEHVDGSIELTKTSGTPYDFEVVLLVNENSASCSEVFAAALREQKNIQIVGTTTYGKGTVQVIQPFSNGSGLKYTTAAWLTPQGNSINGEGVHPDVEVYLDDALYLSSFVFEDGEIYPYDCVSDKVKNAQIVLKFLGYSIERTDGYFDQTTVNCIKAFQKDHELTVNGIFNQEVANALNSAVLVKWNDERETVDTQLHAAIALFE